MTALRKIPVQPCSNILFACGVQASSSVGSEVLNMTSRIKNFLHDDSGAVTVDWVILTAAVVGLAVSAYTGIKSSTVELSNKISTELTALDVE
jgi:Flp pilus assembly pilin Flp